MFTYRFEGEPVEKRSLAMLLCVLVFVSLPPVSALSEENGEKGAALQDAELVDQDRDELFAVCAGWLFNGGTGGLFAVKT